MLLRHIRYLIAVADHQNFTRAAEALHVSQPTLSQQIRQLEERLGTPLLDRSGRLVRLTDAGKAYVDYARRALIDLDAGKRAIDDVQDLSRGSLRLAVTPTFIAYLIGPLVERFHAKHPRINLTVEEMTQDRIEAKLSGDLLDLGIAFDDVHSPEIDSTPLFSEQLSVVVGREHPWALDEHILTSRALEEGPLVLLTADFATRQFIDAYCKRYAVSARTTIEANSISAIVEIVRRNQLATILPQKIALRQNGLVAVPLQPAVEPRTASLLRRRDAYQSAASRAFSEVACQFAELDL
ncbi:transcriptional regulator CynR [Ensifer sp. ENS07]|uniref:transcriptional regulator CynR n=1 Tax=unclassified Ensifer TaxID=2633371 RepID=UPI001786CFAC|nr:MULTISPECIES: transcriptional regulator CynR [unclassified Ensifer]MBD9508000.1 transcriptional regulator CynR [Ensifer sp. ENS10]MBD9637504.1 transcriptional regulator CynR [Ensifer sp. ENS07]